MHLIKGSKDIFPMDQDEWYDWYQYSDLAFHHSFSHALQVLMRCSLQMVYRSTEELTIRSNGTNCRASLTNRNLLPMVRLVRVF